MIPICFDCGCHSWSNCHGDIRHLTSFNVNGAFDANDGEVTPEELVENVKEGLDTWLAQVTKYSSSTSGAKSAPLPEPVLQPEMAHSRNGYKYSISIESYE